MAKNHKTSEEIKRDELVQEVRQCQLGLESAVRVVKRLQDIISMLPEGTREHKVFQGELIISKKAVLDTYRAYENKHEELESHCLACCLSGNNFIPAFELLQILAERG